MCTCQCRSKSAGHILETTIGHNDDPVTRTGNRYDTGDERLHITVNGRRCRAGAGDFLQ